MSEQLSWAFSIQVIGGPRIAPTGSMAIEAYDKLQVSIEAGATQQVNLAPAGAGTIKLIAMIPAIPDDGLTYKVGANEVALNGPLLLIGDGAVSLLDAVSGSLEFTNSTADHASIEILVGRDATP